MNLATNKLTGLTISVPLFFETDDSIDYATLDRYLTDVCANEHISAIYGMAYNTRYRMLSDDEVFLVNKFIVQKCNEFNQKVYIGHPYSFNKSTLIEYFKKIKSLNIAGVSMLYPERYFGDDEIILEFLKLPNQFGLPTVLHEMKLISGFDGELINWPDELLTKVFEQVKLSAVKEDSKDDALALKVLELCRENDVQFVLAGGGKIRAMSFMRHGITTWLNGSSMFLPKMIDRIYEGFMKCDEKFTSTYLNDVEKPFFNEIVAKYGWHISHKAALEYFGYGTRVERFPHAQMTSDKFNKIVPILDKISASPLIK